MERELVCHLKLPEKGQALEREVVVTISVREEPDFPTTLERGRIRLPMVNEWAEIVGKLAKLEFESIETR